MYCFEAQNGTSIAHCCCRMGGASEHAVVQQCVKAANVPKNSSTCTIPRVRGSSPFWLFKQAAFEACGVCWGCALCRVRSVGLGDRVVQPSWKISLCCHTFHHTATTLTIVPRLLPPPSTPHPCCVLYCTVPPAAEVAVLHGWQEACTAPILRHVQAARRHHSCYHWTAAFAGDGSWSCDTPAAHWTAVT
jgi:hypothetical protein